MCIQPTRIDAHTAVPCRLCWQCRASRVNDLVGRCLAEQAVSDQTLAVTLTYCGDTPNAVILAYRDVQLFLKRLHKAGYDCRYFVVGEYGGKKGRAHWHIILFLRGKTFEIVEVGQRENDWQVVLPRFEDDDEARVQWEPWSKPAENRGFVYVQHPDYGGFQYLLKYVLKPDGHVGIKKAQMSKYPPLGHDFFVNMADDLVEKRLPVQLPTYQFANVRDKNGKHISFCLRGRMREIFLDRYRTMWRMQYAEPEPQSDWYAEKYDEKVEAARLIEWTKEKSNEYEKFVIGPMMDRLRTAKAAAGAAYAAAEKEKIAAWDAIAPVWLPRSLYWHDFTHAGKPARIRAFKEGYALVDLGDGKEPWRVGAVENGNRKDVEEQLLRTRLRPSALSQLVPWLLFIWSQDLRSYLDRFGTMPACRVG